MSLAPTSDSPTATPTTAPAGDVHTLLPRPVLVGTATALQLIRRAATS